MRSPIEGLLRAAASALGINIVPIGEASLFDLKVRPDYAIEVNGAVCGYLEAKAPHKGADTSKFSDDHDRKQWEKLKALPNVLYTSGNEWALYREGERIGEIACMIGDVRTAGATLVPDDNLSRLLAAFLQWSPTPPRTVQQLVSSIAMLCRLLRDEVTAALGREGTDNHGPFSALAADWRDLLFPMASDEQFADGYAQSVCFALLLARSDGIDFTGRSVTEIARLLGKDHSLMGKALSVLTDESVGAFSVTLDTLVRVVGVVNWRVIERTGKDPYLYLYERFLEAYDPELRKETGSYYTPVSVVDAMVALVDDVLRTRLMKPLGFAADGVTVIDPAMGTGTYLLSVVRHAAKVIADDEGPGAVPAKLRSLARRVIGLEIQTGPYAVAELRTAESFRTHKAELPDDGMRLYVANTLDNPYIEETHLGAGYEPIARSRRAANAMKRDEPIVVVIGNPPYRDHAGTLGGWIESGDLEANQPAPLDGFRALNNGVNEYVLSNLYVYFWRWATWKVYDAHLDAPAGIVAFITPSGYLTGPGFAGMREYLRRTADEGWIIDLTPEGHQPPVATRIFPKVQQPLAIAIFVRKGLPDPATPATIHYITTIGTQEEKFKRLSEITLEDDSWLPVTNGWQDTMQPFRSKCWIDAPGLTDMMPWCSLGVTANRNWIFAPNPATLHVRWWRLVNAEGTDQKNILLKNTSDRFAAKKNVEAIPGQPAKPGPLANETADCTVIRIALRSFDRQWIIPDARVIDRPRRDLWAVAGPTQVFATQQFDRGIKSGPAITFASEVPEVHHFANRGGRVHPLWRDSSGQHPNVSPRLLGILAFRLGQPISGEDFFAYLAAVAAHPAFTLQFLDDLKTPGLRIPLTAKAHLWREAVTLGREVIWLHTYGERFCDPSDGRPNSPPRLPALQSPKVVTAIPDSPDEMPDDISYDASTSSLHIGKGRVAPVSEKVWLYDVNGMRILRKWFGYRKKDPAAKRTSELDHIVATTWCSSTTTDLLNLIHVLGRLVTLEPAQADLLKRIAGEPQITVIDLADAKVLPVDEEASAPMVEVLETTTLFHKKHLWDFGAGFSAK